MDLWCVFYLPILDLCAEGSPALRTSGSGLLHCFIFHASFKSLEGFISNVGGGVKLVHEENRGDMVYWDFNIQNCLQELFSVNPSYFLLNYFIF